MFVGNRSYEVKSRAAGLFGKSIVPRTTSFIFVLRSNDMAGEEMLMTVKAKMGGAMNQCEDKAWVSVQSQNGIVRILPSWKGALTSYIG